MKKFWSGVYCGLFFVIIIMPSALMGFGNTWLAETGNTGLAENRVLAPAPVLFEDGSFNRSVTLQAEDYFNDRFAGRTNMINTYNRLIANVFGISANEKVIMGTDGWLFFNETLGDFDGSATLDDMQAETLLQILLNMKQEAGQRGQVFIIAVAPNKNTLYGEYMPPGHRRTDEPTNLGRLLASQQLECVNLADILQSMRVNTGQDLYYKTDSHWNSPGARTAAVGIITAILEKTQTDGIIGTAGTDGTVSTDGTNRWYNDITGTVSEVKAFTGDLAQMLYPINPPAETEYIYDDIINSYTYTGRYRGPDDMNITTQSDGIPLKVAMYRDSFANSLIPFISAAFSDVYYTRQTPPPLNNKAFTEADVIIFQIAERRLGEILEWKPVNAD